MNKSFAIFGVIFMGMLEKDFKYEHEAKGKNDTYDLIIFRYNLIIECPILIGFYLPSKVGLKLLRLVNVDHPLKKMYWLWDYYELYIIIPKLKILSKYANCSLLVYWQFIANKSSHTKTNPRVWSVFSALASIRCARNWERAGVYLLGLSPLYSIGGTRHPWCKFLT